LTWEGFTPQFYGKEIDEFIQKAAPRIDFFGGNIASAFNFSGKTSF